MTLGAGKVVAACLIASLLPIFAAAEVRAVLRPSRGVSVNGVEVRSSAAVADGDKIETAAFPAVLTGKGWLVELAPDTALEMRNGLQLGCGGVSVTGEEAIQVNSILVTPSRGARYDIVNRGDTLQIDVHSGSVQVKGDKAETISQGQSVTRPGSPGCKPLGNSSVPRASSAKTGKAALIVGAGAGGAVVLLETMKGKDTDKSISPYRP